MIPYSEGVKTSEFFMGTTSLTYAAVYLCVIFILMQCDHKKQSTMILNMLEEC